MVINHKNKEILFSLLYFLEFKFYIQRKSSWYFNWNPWIVPQNRWSNFLKWRTQSCLAILDRMLIEKLRQKTLPKSQWITIDHNGSQLITMDHNGSQWITIDHNWSLLITMDHNWSQLITMDHNWSQLITMDHNEVFDLKRRHDILCLFQFQNGPEQISSSFEHWSKGFL